MSSLYLYTRYRRGIMYMCELFCWIIRLFLWNISCHMSEKIHEWNWIIIILILLVCKWALKNRDLCCNDYNDYCLCSKYWLYFCAVFWTTHTRTCSVCGVEVEKYSRVTKFCVFTQSSLSAWSGVRTLSIPPLSKLWNLSIPPPFVKLWNPFPPPSLSKLMRTPCHV